MYKGWWVWRRVHVRISKMFIRQLSNLNFKEHCFEGCFRAGHILIKFLFCAAFRELVFVTDNTNDVSQRHLEAGLPSNLEFHLERTTDRGYGHLTLQLEENKRLNQNAPMYRSHRNSAGLYEAVRVKDDMPLTVIYLIFILAFSSLHMVYNLCCKIKRNDCHGNHSKSQTLN